VAYGTADLIDDRHKRQASGANARRMFVQSFTFDAMFVNTMAVYPRILEMSDPPDGDGA
jgi:hypothetical protein